MALTEVLPDLHLFEDTCNVYILRDGDRALLIDCGSRLPNRKSRLIDYHQTSSARGQYPSARGDGD